MIELNEPGTAVYGTVLNNAANVIKAFAPEPTEVEVVCHDSGIDLLLPGNAKLNARVLALEKSGVRFAACSNTLRGRHIKPSQLIKGVVVVDSGVAEVVRKEEAGWSYLKGGF